MPGARSFSVVFDDVEELDAEYFENLSAGGLRVETTAKIAPFTSVSLTLAVAGGPEVTAPATVVAPLPSALALSFEGKPADLLQKLKEAPPAPPPAAEEDEPKDETNLWDRLRNLSHTEKILLAPKADRTERAVLLQDSDPQVLFYLLRNPRIGVEEVVRIAKSSLLQVAMAELIMKTAQWYANVDIRVALVHNPRVPVPYALRILKTLPESEVKSIAKGNTGNQTLKQAALKMVVES